MKVAIIIPTYNEAGGIGALLESLYQILAQYREHEWLTIIVDANSPDDTAKIVEAYRQKNPRVHLFVEEKKSGIGAAYGTGYLYAIEKLHADVLVSFDGDGQHNPSDIPRLVEEINNGADYAIGSRYIPGGSIPKEWAFHRKILSRFGGLYARLLLELPVHDVTSGLRAMRVRNFAEKLSFKPEQILSKQYAYIFQFTHEMVRLGADIREIPIVFRKREYDTSKSTLKDILESLRVTGILRLKTLNEWRLLKVVAIGGTGFILQTLIFELLGFWLGLVRPSTAVLIGGEMAIISNFLLNNRFSFKDRLSEASGFLTRLTRFHIVALGSVFIQWVFVRSFENLFGYHQILLSCIYVFAVVVGLSITYTGYIFWVWRKEKTKK